MEPETKVTRRRRIYIIDREFQYRYMTTWILMTLMFVGVNVLVLYLGARAIRHKLASEVVLEHLSFLMQAGAYFVVCVTIFIGCLLLLMSHRIAGPAYRLRKCLARIAKGDYSFDVKLRKRDYMKGVADSLNVVIARLRARRERFEAMRELWRKAASAAAAAPDGERIVAEINAAFDDVLRIEPPGEETKNLLSPHDTTVQTKG